MLNESGFFFIKEYMQMGMHHIRQNSLYNSDELENLEKKFIVTTFILQHSLNPLRRAFV